jgi:hypothetical protein
VLTNSRNQMLDLHQQKLILMSRRMLSLKINQFMIKQLHLRIHLMNMVMDFG